MRPGADHAAAGTRSTPDPSEAEPPLPPQSARVSLGQVFTRAAQWTSRQCGRPPVFALALASIILWIVTGPIFRFSDAWQLVINTGTTIITFLMVFLIQNTQNRDTAAMQLKLDELIRVTKNARNRLLSLEDLTDEELERMKQAFARLGAQTAGDKAAPRAGTKAASARPKPPHPTGAG